MTRINDIYISPALADKLESIGSHPITTVVAPMGYGKTTAVTWWARKHPEHTILRQMIDTDSLTDLWNGLCRTLGRGSVLAEQLTALGFPEDTQAMSVLAEILEEGLQQAKGPVFYILDDLHIIRSKPIVIDLLRFLSRRLEHKLRFVLLSRGDIFTGGDRMGFGAKLHELTADDLRLDREEVIGYARRCGIRATPQELSRLADSSEGWISMIYLNFKTYDQTGVWLKADSDIYNIIDQVLFSPLQARQQLFLTLIGMVDSFTEEEAAWLWQEADAGELLASLTRSNAFITQSEQGVYRYHHMLRECARQKFTKEPEDWQKAAWIRLGDWHRAQHEFIDAEISYRKAGAWDKLLAAFSEDCGKTLGAEHADAMYEWSQSCPVSILAAHPDAVLVFMRKHFSFSRIPEMFSLKEILLRSLEENTALSQQEKQDYLGECELVMSFLKYNDISAMSGHHRKACAMMSRFSRCIDPKGTWTFGAPSILMSYHRTAGGLDGENGEMRECMPYYYQVVDYHGNGAEHVMQGETEFMRGNLSDAELSYHFAINASTRKAQYSIAVTAEFLALRMALMAGDGGALAGLMERERTFLREHRQYILLKTWDMCETWILSLLGHTEEVPGWIAEEGSGAMVMTPALPMLQTIYNQYLLSRSSWSKIVARKEECLELFTRSNALLCRIYLHIQLAAALEMLGKHPEALDELRTALELALPDGIYMPFVENSDRIMALLSELQESYPGAMAGILKLSRQFLDSRQKICRQLWGEEGEDYGLTERELEIAKLAARRKTNLEIAKLLNLTEGTVRSHMKHIYDKLELGGTAKNKRFELEKRFHD